MIPLFHHDNLKSVNEIESCPTVVIKSGIKEIHFVTFSVVEWVDVFTRKEYRDIIIESLKFCQKEKSLLLHSWCIMSNHVHLIASARNEDLSDILRDFKKFTSKQIISAIENNEHESRKDCPPG